MTDATSGPTAETANLLAVPFDYHRGDPERLTRLLDTFADHPQWLTTPLPREEARALAGYILVDPKNVVYEVWRGGEFLGVVLLTNIVPQVDATIHVLFLDRNLVGKRRFLLSFLGMCFEDLGFQRLTWEIPEDVEPLVSFIRRKLGFRYEGETKFPDYHGPHRAQAVGAARLASRREHAMYRDGRWVDVLRLRLLRDEYKEHTCPSPPVSPCSEPPSSGVPSEVPSAAGPTPTPTSPKT